eukprot:scaffold477397_cov19-Prasinocladus_malaysianus.AAC.2
MALNHTPVKRAAPESQYDYRTTTYFTSLRVMAPLSAPVQPPSKIAFVATGRAIVTKFATGTGSLMRTNVT